MNINITTQGDSSVRLIGSSTGGKVLRSFDNNGSGEYLFGYDYKFATNKNLVAIIVNFYSGGVNSHVISSSIDNSFTIQAGTTTASLNVVFSPQREQDNIFVPIPNTYGKTQPAFVTSGFNFLNYVSPIVIDAAQSGVTLPTSNDYIAGYMIRYFYKQSNDVNGLVREVSKVQFDSLNSNFLYTTLQIKWKITGDADKVKEINRDIIEIANQQLLGIQSLLQRNLLQYWKTGSFSPATEFDVTAKVKSTNMVAIS